MKRIIGLCLLSLATAEIMAAEIVTAGMSQQQLQQSQQPIQTEGGTQVIEQPAQQQVDQKKLPPPPKVELFTSSRDEFQKKLINEVLYK